MRQWSARAFTLVELVIVIAIVGILAAIAIPRFIDIRTEAYNAQRDGILGSVRAGILTVAASNQAHNCTNVTNPTFPPNLEANWNNACNGIAGGTQPGAFPSTCNPPHPCFELVIAGGVAVTDGSWRQSGPTAYTFTHPITNAAIVYNYNSTDGTFQ